MSEIPTILKPGDVFGNLTYIKDAQLNEKRGTKNPRALFLCSCGRNYESSIEYIFTKPNKCCRICDKEKFGVCKKAKGEAAKHRIYLSYKTDCIRNNKDFNISEDELIKIVSNNCFYCGQSPQRIVKGAKNTNGSFTCNGIDRLNGKIGYNLENCVTACYMCNRAKYTLCKEDFLNHYLNSYIYLLNSQHEYRHFELLDYQIKQLEYIHYHYKYRIVRRGEIFTITTEDFNNIVLQDCYYCGGKPKSDRALSKYRQGLRTPAKYNGITKINLHNGFTKENVRPCCTICNKAKIKTGEKELLEWLSRLYSYQSNLTNTPIQ